MNSNYSLNKGQVLKVSTLTGVSEGIFKDIVILAQVLPALILDIQGKTILVPVQNIVSIELPTSSILSPTLSETKEAQFSKL